MAAPRRIRPDYDEKFTVEEPLEFEDAVKRLVDAPVDASDEDGDTEDGDS